MRPLQGLVWGYALAALAALATPAHAGWNNVFQVCCSSCGGPSAAPAVANFADPGCAPACAPACPPCPQTTCTTRYIQRTYYQPVTTYRMSTSYTPVTSYRTSYYYEPVCSYRYSCYYDPCTCRYQTVATPTTSYLLRSRCCPVTSYLQRTCMTPVTTMRAMCYYEPVTTCCTTSAGNGTNGNGSNGNGSLAPVTPAPAVRENSGSDSLPPAPGDTNPPPAVGEKSAPRTPYPPPGVMPGASRRGGDKSLKFRGDRFASRSGRIDGRLVDSSRQPRSRVKVLFVSVERKSNQLTATTDRDGYFSASLSSGGWLVYTYDKDGRPVFSRRIEVPSSGREVQLTLVKR